MPAQILAPVGYALLFIAIIWKWRFFRLEGITRAWMVGAFVLKIISGLFFWWVYTQYYPDTSQSDALRYFSDAQTIHRQWNENREVFWSFMMGGRDMSNPDHEKIYEHLVGWTSGYRYGLTNDCSTIIRINTLISFISFGSYHVHSLFMSFMAFIGFTALFRAFSQVLLHRLKWLFVACFLLPSVVFWSSALLKEGPLFMCLGILFWSIASLMNDGRKYIFYVLLLLSLSLLFYIKEYVIISLLPALVFLLVVRIIGQRYLWLKFIVVHVVCFMVAQHAHHFFTGGDFLYVLHKKRVDFYNVGHLHNAGSMIDIPEASTTSNFFIHYPEAFFATYFRPHLFEAREWIYMFFSLENCAYLLLCLLAIIFFKRPEKKGSPILWAVFSYVLVLAAILGYCVPILGAMVRYRVAALPFLVIICIAVISTDRIKKVIRRF